MRIKVNHFISSFNKVLSRSCTQRCLMIFSRKILLSKCDAFYRELGIYACACTSANIRIAASKDYVFHEMNHFESFFWCNNDSTLLYFIYTVPHITRRDHELKMAYDEINTFVRGHSCNECCNITAKKNIL